jgi:ketosteroid isomerase-like protein
MRQAARRCLEGLQLPPATCAVVGNDLLQHPLERPRLDRLAKVVGDLARGLVVVATGDDLVRVGDNRAVVAKADVSVIRAPSLLRESRQLERSKASVGEFNDAGMMRDYDRFASLFTEDGAWRMPHIPAEFVDQDEVRAGVERLQNHWQYFVQNTHPGTIELDGDSAVGRSYIFELMHGQEGDSQLHYAVYHDRYRRTGDGWKLAERTYELRYLDTTPLAGSALQAA